MVSKEEKIRELEEKIDGLKRKIDGLKIEESERSSLEERINVAREALKEGKVKEAAGIVKEIIAKVKSAGAKPKKAKRPAKKEEGVGKEDAVAALKRVKGLIDAGGVSEGSLKEAQVKFSMGQAYFREGRFKDAVEALKEAENIILIAREAEKKLEEVEKEAVEEEKVEEEKEAEKKPEEVEKEAAEEEKVEEKVEEEKYLKVIEDFFGRLERLKGLGGDLSPIEEHIRFIEGARDAGDTRGAAETAASLEDWLDQYISALEGKAEGVVKGEEEGLRAKIDEFLRKVEEIENLGGDTTPIKEHLAYINGALSAGDIKGAFDVVETLSEWVETYLDTLHAPQVEEKAEEVEEKKEVEVGEREEVKKESEVAPEEVRVEEKIEEAKEEVAVEERGAEVEEKEAVEKAPEREEEGAKIEEERKKEIAQKLEEYEKEMDKLAEEGLDVGPLRRIHSLTKGKLEAGELEGAGELLRRFEIAHRNLIKKKYSSKIEELQRRLGERAGYFASQGVDVETEDLSGLMDSIKKELEEGDVKRVGGLIEEFERRLASFERDAYNMLYQRRMIPIINGIKSLEERGVDVSRLRGHLESVKELFMGGDYSGWERESLQLERNVQAYEANYLLNRLREAVVKLGEVGGPQGVYTQKYNEAVGAYREGSFAAVIEMCESTLKETERLYEEHSYRRLKESLLELITRGEQLGVSTEPYRETLSRSDELFTEGGGVEAKRILEESIETLRAEVEVAESLRKRVEELSGELNEIWNQLLPMARKGYPTSEVSRKVQKARELLKEMKVDEAAELVEKIRRDIERLSKGPTKEVREEVAEEGELETLRAKELSIIISQIRDRITKMKALGIDTSKYQSDLLLMLQTFKRGELDRAVEQGRRCLSNIKKELGE